MPYLIYLRKSRADIEAESRGEGETLAKHEAALLSLANRMGLSIGAVYREIVSGETIAARPKMQELLSEVGAGKWEGVLVMEIERLARGNTMDQGLVSNAFTYSGTKIVTPMKIYDPKNEFDNEYFEFNLFMSRREYKTIRRRMEAGRISAVKEGCYIGSRDPFGYKRFRREDGKYSLQIVPPEAETVKLIFYLYTSTESGFQKTANRLNEIGSKPQRSDMWTANGVREIIRNPIYKGYIRWNKRHSEKHMDGSVSKPLSDEKDVIIVRGLHEPIISEEIWKKANENRPVTKAKNRDKKELINPFAGLMKCGYCGHAIYMRCLNDKTPLFCFCKTPGCKCVGSHGNIVMAALMQCLSREYRNYSLRYSEKPMETTHVSEIEMAERELKKYSEQMSKLYDLLEQGIYSTEVFEERQRLLSEKTKSLKKNLKELKEKESTSAASIECAAKIKNVLDNIIFCETAEEKNNLLKTVVRNIRYYKSTNNRWTEETDLLLEVDLVF